MCEWANYRMELTDQLNQQGGTWDLTVLQFGADEAAATPALRSARQADRGTDARIGWEACGRWVCASSMGGRVLLVNGKPAYWMNSSRPVAYRTGRRAAFE